MPAKTAPKVRPTQPQDIHLTLGQIGDTFEQYKEFVTGLLKELTGKEPTSTEEEWRADYEEYLAQLNPPVV